jgi:hypothetical protein
MGAFFTNVQLRTADLDKLHLVENITNYIIKINNDAGFVKVDNEDEAGKTIIILPSGDLDWVSIYDEDTEDQSLRKLNKLASVVSKHFNTIALSILVNDSDSLYIGVNKNGVLKDAISNLSKKVDFNKNKPLAWSDVLVENYSFENIKNAWQNKSVFVEHFLTPFAKFIDIDASRILTGYNRLSQEKPNEGVKLNFAEKDKKKTVLGATKLTMLHGSGLIDIKKGEKQDVEWMVANQGTFSNGIDIVIAGDAIDHQLLIPEMAKLTYFRHTNENQNKFIASFVETTATTGEKIFHARIDDIYIPKGINPTYPMSPKEAKRSREIQYNSAIRINLSFTGGNDGPGDLEIFFSPLVNRQDGSYRATFMKGTMEEWLKKEGL